MPTSTKTRYLKVVETRGFISLICRAREHLGLPEGSSLLELPSDSDPFGRYSVATWTILDLLDLPGTDGPFVMNAIAFGIPRALETNGNAPAGLLVLDIPKSTIPSIREVLYANLTGVTNGPPVLDMVHPGDLFYNIVQSGQIFILQGLPALDYILEREKLILFNVTNATLEDFRKVGLVITSLRRELNLPHPKTHSWPLLLNPQIAKAVSYKLSGHLAEILWPEPPDIWMEATEDGKPSGVWYPWHMLDSLDSAPASIVKGRGTLAQIVRNSGDLYLDVTDLTSKDLRASFPSIKRVRMERGIQRPASRCGPGATLDEEKAVQSARKAQSGEPIRQIAAEFGWTWYQDPAPSGQSPTTRAYIHKGNEIILLVNRFDEVMARYPF